MTHYLERSRGVLVSLRPPHPHSADSDPGNQPLLHAPRKRNFWSRALHFKKTWSTQFQGSWLTQPLLWVEVIFLQTMKSMFCNNGKLHLKHLIVKEIDRLVPLFSQLENCSILKVSLQSILKDSSFYELHFLDLSARGWLPCLHWTLQSWTLHIQSSRSWSRKTNYFVFPAPLAKKKVFCLKKEIFRR